MLETAPGLRPDNSRCGSCVWGMERGWNQLEADARVSCRSSSTSGTTKGTGINAQWYLQ